MTVGSRNCLESGHQLELTHLMVLVTFVQKVNSVKWTLMQSIESINGDWSDHRGKVYWIRLFKSDKLFYLF